VGGAGVTVGSRGAGGFVGGWRSVLLLRGRGGCVRRLCLEWWWLGWSGRLVVIVPRGVEGGLIGLVGSVGAFDVVCRLGVLEGGIWRVNGRGRSLLRQVRSLSYRGGSRRVRGVSRGGGCSGVLASR